MDEPDIDANAALADVLDQLVTMPVENVAFSPLADGGQLAHVTVSGGTHEILCELSHDRRVLSARVIEL